MVYYSTNRNISALLDRAIQIATSAHAGQMDRGGMPYITHPLRLMMKQSTLENMIVAVLHDVVEDSDWTLDDLRNEGFPEPIIAAIDALTHRENEPYDANLQRIHQNAMAIAVKKSDLEDNINALRLATLHEKDFQRLQKYHKAYRFLTRNTE